jgi:hypothetical protein
LAAAIEARTLAIFCTFPEKNTSDSGLSASHTRLIRTIKSSGIGFLPVICFMKKAMPCSRSRACAPIPAPSCARRGRSRRRR